MKNYHTLNISLNTSFIPDLAGVGDKVTVKIGEKEYEFTMQSVQHKINTHEMDSWGSVACYRIRDYDDFQITGWLVDKNAEAVKIAKQDVRQKQQEFKDAQRKLSELMGNKI